MTGLFKNISTSANSYIISIAFTNEVATKGRISVSHSQCVMIAKINAAVEARNTSHHIPLYFLVCSIIKSFGFTCLPIAIGTARAPQK